MKGEDKAKEQLINELSGLRRKIGESEASVTQHKVAEELITADASTDSQKTASHEWPQSSAEPPGYLSEASQPERSRVTEMKSSLLDSLAKVNRELWLILSLLVIALIMNYLITAQRMLLGLYTLPAVFSAYFYGRRHATLTAFASVFLVGLLTHYNPALFGKLRAVQIVKGPWFDITAWGAILVLTAYAMGTLHERLKANVEELRQTYHGLLLILRQFISKDKYTENHSYRVSIYAAKIAAYLRLNRERIEDVRGASLLHDIGKLDISRQLLYKAARLTWEEDREMNKHVEKGGEMLQPVEGPLSRILPIILAHHDKFDGSGRHPSSGEKIPLEARIISVADVYDSLISDRPYRKAMSPFDARDIIVKGSGTEFDPGVVSGFLAAFNKGEMEVPDMVL
ncbi:MAG: HD domain-containing phosphohydrolase [Desulfobacteria bacterium]